MNNDDFALESERFHIQSVLGYGGMGRVFRAFDKEFGDEVALKSLHHVSAQDLFHLKHEFRVLAGLFHPNLVRLYELFVEGNYRFFTMEPVVGQNVVDFVRGGLATGEPLDTSATERLASSFCQIADAIAFLHERGRTHGDVKPSNLLVEQGGRAVVLDFGLSTAKDEFASGTHAEIAGTLAYMAPERLAGAESASAADWYGVGATLYETLTGTPPRPYNQMDALTNYSPAAPITGLATHLLAPDPNNRASAEEIHDILAQELSEPYRLWATKAPSIKDRPFVDREEPMAKLEESFESTRERVSIVFVRGPSGIGKSELISRFADLAKARGALVLKGRCLHQESVSYRALDPVVDELSTYLLSLQETQVRNLVPLHANALIKVFPVLARVNALSARDDLEPLSDDETIRRASAALRVLLRRISNRRPLIIWIDDVQWGDRGSVGLLRSIVRSSEAPHLQLILSFRSEDEETSDLLREVRASMAAIAPRTIDIGPLPSAYARELVQKLEPSLGTLRAAAKEKIVTESLGSPFLLSELARHSAADVHRDEADFSIERVLLDRTRVVSPEARKILEVVSVAGRPTAIDLILEVAGLAASARKHVLELGTQSLLRRGATNTTGDDEIEMYHDRLREATLITASKKQLQIWHGKLAAALRIRPDPDPERLVEHYVGAGEQSLAARYAVIAAEAAEEMLRFDRAAEFFALALRLRGRGDEDWHMQQRRADALANAGRGAEAADAYVLAAQAGQRIEPDQKRHANLTGLAAEHYLYSGHVTAGLERTREVMRHFGVRTPTTSRYAMLAANAMRLRFLATGVPKPKPQQSSETDDHLQALFGTAKGTALLFPKLSDYLGMHYLCEAIRVGDPEHLAIAIAKEASIEGALPGERWRRRASRLLDVASEIAELCDEPHVDGTVLTCRGAFHYFSGQWQASRRTCEEAIRIFRSECVGHNESSSITFHFLIPTVAQQGDLAHLARILPEFDEDARRRGDLTAANVLEAGDSALLRLAQDRPGEVVNAADRLLDSPSGERYSVSHYHHLLATARAALYRGDPEKAWKRVIEAWKPVRSIGLLTFECYSVVLKHLRASVALSLAKANGVHRARMKRIARADARWLARSSLPHAPPLAASLRSGLLALDGSDDRARAEMEKAASGLAAADMPLHCAAAGIHLGGSDAVEARLWMQTRNIVDPQRMSAAVLGC